MRHIYEARPKVAAAIICHDDSTYLGSTIRALGNVPTTVFVDEVAWNQAPSGDWQRTAHIAGDSGAAVITGTWAEETEHRRFVLNWAIEQQIDFLIIPDSDEILTSELLANLQRIAIADLADNLHCSMDTYWKSPEYVIRPRSLMPTIMVKPNAVRHEHIREFKGGRVLYLPPEYGVMHHLSYCGPEERIIQKLGS